MSVCSPCSQLADGYRFIVRSFLSVMNGFYLYQLVKTNDISLTGVGFPRLKGAGCDCVNMFLLQVGADCRWGLLLVC